MKRRGVGNRRQVLDLNNKKSNSPSRQTWQTKYQQICIDHNSQNGVNENTQSPPSPPTGPSLSDGSTSGINSLRGLIGNYHSDSDEENNVNGDENPRNLDSKVADFLKEIQEIAPLEDPKQSQEPEVAAQITVAQPTQKLVNQSKSHPSQHHGVLSAEQVQYNQQQAVLAATPQPTIAWQECYDENTGYTYYWNMHTNEVTWEVPVEYQQYRVALEQWHAAQQHMQIYAMGAVISTKQKNLLPNSTSQSNAGLKDHGKKAVVKKRRYPLENASESDDEKIEMITSYGSYSGDDTDSEDDQEDRKKKKGVKSPPPVKKKIIKREKMKLVKSIDKPVVLGPKLPKNMEVSEPSSEFGPQLPPDYLLKAEGNSNSPHSPALASLVAYGPDADNDDEGEYSSETVVKSTDKDSISFSVNDCKHVLKTGDKQISILSKSDETNSKLKDSLNKNIADKQEDMLLLDKKSDEKSSLALQRLRKLKQKAENNTDDSSSESSNGSSDEEKVEDHNDLEEDDEIDENVIISRLRSQANILKELGGEIPDSIKELISEDRPSSFSMIAGYGDDSDIEEAEMDIENEDQKIDVEANNKDDKKVIKEEIKKCAELTEESKVRSDCSNSNEASSKVGDEATTSRRSSKKLSKSANLKIIKLSARAKALINASITTAKARATNFVSTADGLKPADSVKLLEDQKCQSDTPGAPLPSSVAVNETKIVKSVKKSSEKNHALLIGQSETLPAQPSAFVGVNEIKNVKPLKKSSGKLLEKSAVIPSTSSISSKQNTNGNVYASYWASAQSGTDRRGFGYGFTQVIDEEKSESSKGFVKKGMIQFVKGEPEKNVSVSTFSSGINQEFKGETGKYRSSLEVTEKEIADLKDLSNTIKEKVTFLSEGKEPVSPVQIMAIQLETLMTAWEDGSLAVQYLSKWLKSTDNQLKSLEQAAVPENWSCHWDRLHKRYYYCHLETSAIQWEYPEVCPKIQNQGSGDEAMELCTTPPHPLSSSAISSYPLKEVVQEHFTPPPAPVISENLSTQKSGPDYSLSQKSDSSMVPSPPPPPSIREESPPPLPLLPLVPPLPPPPSPPPLPPPPPSITPPEMTIPLAHGEPLPPGVDLPERSFYSAQPPPPPPPPISSPPPPPPESPPPLPPPPPPPSHSPPLPPIQLPSDSSYSAPVSHYQIPAVYHNVSVSGQIEATNSLPYPPPLQAETNLASELDSFYSDIAALDPSPPVPSEPPPLLPSTILPVPPPPLQTDEIGSTDTASSSTAPVLKKKKKTKLAPGLSLKMKGVSSLVAKWQQVQEDVRRDMKSPEAEKIMHR